MPVDPQVGLVPIHLPPLPSSPTVSVASSSYNHAAFVSHAVRSVANQTYPVLDHIVVDDGSTDGSGRILTELADVVPNLRVHLQTNQGQRAAYNRAVAEARGDIILFLDSDDAFRPDKVAASVEAFRRAPAAGLLTHRMAEVDASGRVVDLYPPLSTLPTGWLAAEVLASGGMVAGMAATSGLGLRREVADVAFPLPVGRSWFDAHLTAIATLVTEVVSIERALTEYRWHGSNETFGARLSADVLSRRVDARQEVWEAQHHFLEGYAPRAVPLLTPLDHSRVHVEQMYVLSRIERDGNDRELYEKLRATPQYTVQPTLRRMFWDAAPHLPRSVFLRVMDQLTRPSWGRRVLGNARSLGTRSRP